MYVCEGVRVCVRVYMCVHKHARLWVEKPCRPPLTRAGASMSMCEASTLRFARIGDARCPPGCSKVAISMLRPWSL
jgi:hypothetical protein